MWILGLVIYLSIGFLFSSYQDYLYENMINQNNFGQYQRKTFEAEQAPSLVKSLLFWPLEVTAWGILWLTYIIK